MDEIAEFICKEWSEVRTAALLPHDRVLRLTLPRSRWTRSSLWKRSDRASVTRAGTAQRELDSKRRGA